MNGRSNLGTLLYFLTGPLVWALHFGVLYAGQSMLCALGAASPVSAFVTIVTLFALAFIAFALVVPDILRDGQGAQHWAEEVQIFLDSAMRILAFLSGMGVIWGGITAFLLPACAALR